jgi:hypothetical protein
MTDMPLNTKTPTRDLQVEDNQKSTFVAVLLLILAIWVIQSPFLQNATGGWEIIILIGLVIFGFSKFVNGYLIPLWFNLVILGVFLLAAWMINNSDHDYAWWGAVLLFLAVVGDAAYTAYLYFYKKVDMWKPGYWACIAGAAVSGIMLIYTLIKA